MTTIAWVVTIVAWVSFVGCWTWLFLVWRAYRRWAEQLEVLSDALQRKDAEIEDLQNALAWGEDR